MAVSDSGGRTVEPGATATAVVDFRCEHCAASLSVDSPTYEDILANGCVACGTPVGAAAFRRRETA
jgi:hypothetical protein